MPAALEGPENLLAGIISRATARIDVDPAARALPAIRPGLMDVPDVRRPFRQSHDPGRDGQGEQFASITPGQRQWTADTREVRMIPQVRSHRNDICSPLPPRIPPRSARSRRPFGCLPFALLLVAIVSTMPLPAFVPRDNRSPCSPLQPAHRLRAVFRFRCCGAGGQAVSLPHLLLAKNLVRGLAMSDTRPSRDGLLARPTPSLAVMVPRFGPRRRHQRGSKHREPFSFRVDTRPRDSEVEITSDVEFRLGNEGLCSRSDAF